MPKVNKLRPSAHDQGVLCVGSVNAQAPYGWTTNEAAERGKRLHDATALILQTGEKGVAKVKANELILDDDYAQVQECIDQADKLKPLDPDVIMLVEQKLDLAHLGLTGGKADLIYISIKFRALVIIDWKFGVGFVPDPQDNRQMVDYGIGAIKLAKEKYGIDIESVEAYIIQPNSFREDDKYREHTWSTQELVNLTPMIMAEAMAVQAVDAPRTAGVEQCKFCSHKEKCPEYIEWNGQREEAKATAHAQDIENIVGSGIMVVADEELKAPVNLIAQSTVDRALKFMDLAKSITVVDGATANTAGTMSKEMRKIITLIKEKGLALRAPQTAFNKKIIDAEKQATDPLEEGAKAIDAQVGNFIRAEKAKADAIKAEEERKKAEAEAKIEKARLAEEAKQREAQEALRQAELAKERAATLKTQKARDKALALARVEEEKALEAQRQAEEEEEKRLMAERDAELATATAISVPTKIAGYREKEVVTWEVDDISKVPKKWVQSILIVDKKALDALIKQGKITEANSESWLTIKRETVAGRSR